MYKTDLLEYVGKSTLCLDRQRSGAAKLIAEMLNISEVAVSNWNEEIPRARAMQLHKIFRDKDKLKEYGLPLRGALKFDLDIYE